MTTTTYPEYQQPRLFVDVEDGNRNWHTPYGPHEHAERLRRRRFMLDAIELGKRLKPDAKVSYIVADIDGKNRRTRTFYVLEVVQISGTLKGTVWVDDTEGNTHCLNSDMEGLTIECS